MSSDWTINEQLVSVQPMTVPLSRIFYYQARYGKLEEDKGPEMVQLDLFEEFDEQI